MTAYLDNAATTPMRQEAVDAMLPFLRDRFGNPSGSHAVAREARKALDDAREVVAGCLGAEPGEVVFTAGGTEADNLAIAGVSGLRPGRVVCSAVEHHAVLHACAALGDRALVAPVTVDGVVDLDRLDDLLDDLPGDRLPGDRLPADDVCLVSVMLANNEVGTVQPLAEVADLVRRRAPGAAIHSDAVQAFSWLDVEAMAAPADLVAVSAHKFGGPKGVGALVVRRGMPLAPLLHGGGQERDRRSGTHNIAGIAGMAAAMVVTVAEREATVARVASLRDRLAARLVATVPDTKVTAAGAPRVAGSCHVTIGGIESEALLALLDGAGVYASAGSACTSGAVDPSHVLGAMGIPAERAAGALRLSLGPETTEVDIDRALEAIPPAVARLRAES